ncbi:30S ribosomal protein S6 [Candidatus Daviesbacteria bacterium]|nr:30S ribosomal protein S6 [Candidatus Daviesbacteria bacterium]
MNYQLTLLVKESLDEKERKVLLDAIVKNFVKTIKEDLWGIKDMAFSIKRANKAYFAHFEFEAEPNTISSLDKDLKLNEDIIRYLLIRK